jgi:hypothetical protein
VVCQLGISLLLWLKWSAKPSVKEVSAKWNRPSPQVEIDQIRVTSYSEVESLSGGHGDHGSSPPFSI